MATKFCNNDARSAQARRLRPAEMFTALSGAYL